MHVHFTPALVTKAAIPGTGTFVRVVVGVERRILRPLLSALLALQGGVSLAALARAAASEREEDVLEAARVERLDGIIASLADPLAIGVVEGGRYAARDFAGRVVLDMGRPKIAAWLRDHAAELVQQVGDTSREALRTVLQDGILRGRHPRRMAEDLRQVVGLHDRQAAAVARRRAHLLGQGIPEARVQEVTDRYAGQLLRQRVRLIAHNESMTAVSHGRHELWGQLQEEGGLEPDAQREWLTSGDEGVCEICGPMQGQRRGLREPYTTGDGGQVDHPPAHAGCRCTEALV